jgi:hypothetical protein
MHFPSGRLRPTLQEPSGEFLETFFATRETYEKSLRGLVLKHPNIRWIAGTVSGINLVPNDNNHIGSVNVRNSDGFNQEMNAALVIGAP